MLSSCHPPHVVTVVDGNKIAGSVALHTGAKFVVTYPRVVLSFVADM